MLPQSGSYDLNKSQRNLQSVRWTASAVNDSCCQVRSRPSPNVNNGPETVLRGDRKLPHATVGQAAIHLVLSRHHSQHERDLSSNTFCLGKIGFCYWSDALKTNDPVLLFKTIFKHLNCLLSSVGMDGKDHWRMDIDWNLEKLGQLF